MNIFISRIWIPTADEWDQAWLDCPYSTYFHSREWADIWSEYQGGKSSPSPIAFELSNGTCTIFPLSREKIFRGMVNHYISSPAGTFGGWLAKRDLIDSEQLIVINYIKHNFNNLTWRFNPYQLISCSPEISQIKDETHSLDLSVGFDEIYRKWARGHSSAARKAQKAQKVGVTVKLAETENDWDQYYQTYIDSHQRWGNKATGFYSWRLFKILFERQSSNIKLWLASHEGRIVAGAICFYAPNNVVYWHGAALSSYFGLRPVNLLMYEAIRHAAEKGYSWFDFNPSGGLEGVKNFKRSFGAVALSSDVIQRSSLLVKIIRASYSKMRGSFRC